MPKTAQSKNPQVSTSRVMVFIDNSNVYQSLKALNKIDRQWPKAYNPQILAERLSGNRQLIKTFFYCAPPPEYLKNEGDSGKKKYWTQISYYEEIKKLPNLELKYAYLTGTKGDDLHEKNLDSQLIVDMQREAIQDTFDIAILVGCDGDYQSLAQEIKRLGKRIELLYFRGNRSMSLVMWCDLSRRARLSYFEQLPFSYNEGGSQNNKEVLRPLVAYPCRKARIRI